MPKKSGKTTKCTAVQSLKKKCLRKIINLFSYLSCQWSQPVMNTQTATQLNANLYYVIIRITITSISEVVLLLFLQLLRPTLQIIVVVFVSEFDCPNALFFAGMSRPINQNQNMHLTYCKFFNKLIGKTGPYIYNNVLDTLL